MNEAEIKAGLSVTPGYRYAENVGNQLFVAGQVPHDVDGQLVGVDDPYTQSRQCLDNLLKLLAVHGYSVADIRQLVVYVVGQQANLVQAWTAVTEKFSEGVPPATLLGVATLGHEGQLVEIDATVIKV
ncbi:RidA family protein [Leptolyngbya cf. ectocarpi LEGE 11479]|uniref:RidA family protein n=1 Tax=Leptolyngbya cf. ectocarpi LEGE 11479 TaxID=1828722 RepID=A0A928ZZ16_LEPEC|nr:RidA family protein [Leptolyngbya ectocarpi]MBE9070127.1 RidA family protein [Leptolyngbya cf. ectocarpi LEGE 11479]